MSICVVYLCASSDSVKLSKYIQKNECEQICLSLLLSSALSAAGNGWGLNPPALSVKQRTAALASGFHDDGHPSASWLSRSAPSSCQNSHSSNAQDPSIPQPPLDSLTPCYRLVARSRTCVSLQRLYCSFAPCSDESSIQARTLCFYEGDMRNYGLAFFHYVLLYI